MTGTIDSISTKSPYHRDKLTDVQKAANGWTRIPCLKCDKMFLSSSKKGNRLCARCDHMNNEVHGRGLQPLRVVRH